GLRLDHLLIAPTLAHALVDAGVHTWVRDRPNASDHAPTWIRLDLATPRAARPPARSRSQRRSRRRCARHRGARCSARASTAARPRASRR
ncbi:MAG: exodeoxyribonuclease III, partial [Kofleriaceae bacterium]